MIVTVEIDNELSAMAKRIVKESGFQWKFYVDKTLEKALTELVKTGNVENIIKDGK